MSKGEGKGAGPAVVLLSGGMDSTTCLAIAGDRGYDCHGLSIDYGQRNTLEIEAARMVARAFGVREHRIIVLDLGGIGASALTGEFPLPRGRSPDEMSRGIPPTYVPARNTIFLSLALAWAEAIAAGDIFIGVNAQDHAGYPDCRPAFIRAFEDLAVLATRAGVEGKKRFTIHTPLIRMDKAEIIRTGMALGVDFGLTLSCYDPRGDGSPCGDCDACRLRRSGFEKAGVPDPATLR